MTYQARQADFTGGAANFFLGTPIGATAEGAVIACSVIARQELSREMGFFPVPSSLERQQFRGSPDVVEKAGCHSPPAQRAEARTHVGRSA